MSKRVLIVCPYFAPVNTPDQHRVRVALDYFEKYGWQADVLCVAPEYVGSHNLDPLLEESLPKGVSIYRTYAVPRAISKWFGLGQLGLRAYYQLRKTGGELLSDKEYSIVFISTTEFNVMRLGYYWKQRYGVPYILDYQDPWRSSYYRDNHLRPPGGSLKYEFNQLLAGFFEPRQLKQAAHVISVSPLYISQFKNHYSWFDESDATVLPFSVSKKDFEFVKKNKVQQNIFSPDKEVNWVYVGRVGEYMKFGLRSLFAAIQKIRDEYPECLEGVRLHFIGTEYYADNPDAVVSRLANEYQIENIIVEHPQRVPYFQALSCLLDADLLLLIGSDDPGYSASKLYTNIMAQQPILAMFHENSNVIDIIRQSNGDDCIAFNSITLQTRDGVSEQIAARLKDVDHLYDKPVINDGGFREYTADYMTGRLCEIFDRVCEVAA